VSTARMRSSEFKRGHDLLRGAASLALLASCAAACADEPKLPAETPVTATTAGLIWNPWFVEGGIGATVTSSVYRNFDKHFSTAFNSGDHVGVGYAFGAARKNEIALRAEHFSNAGIKHPNPGQNFVELRYVHHFD